MTVSELLDECDLEHSLLIGYYGGGNFGDELLLETLMNLLKAHKVQDVSVGYRNPATYKNFHHDLGYKLVDTRSRRALLGALFNNKKIIVGGGGLWGMDVNVNILMLGMMLLAARWLLRRKVYLIGVGYYGSTTSLGRASALLAAKAAAQIIVRDRESLTNFRRLSSRVSLDQDIAVYLKDLDLSAYQRDLERLEQRVEIADNTLFVTLRRFRAGKENSYAKLVQSMITAHKTPTVAALMEPKVVDPAGYSLLASWRRKRSNLQVIDFSFNPVVLFLLFRKYRGRLVVIAPQFHVILVAQIADVPFMPIVYDNKVSQLLGDVPKSQQLPIANLKQSDIQSFIRAQLSAA